MSGQPFFFDKHIFDDDPLVGMDKGDLPERPEFTKSDLEREKSEAYEDGKKAGFQESEAGLSRSMLSLLEKIDRDMSVLFAAEDDRGRLYEEEAVHLSLSIVQKLFPLYMAECGGDTLRAAIVSALSDYQGAEDVKIEMNERSLASLKDSVKALEGALPERAALTANPSLQDGECRILWPSGGVVQNHSAVAEKTFNIMKEALAERGVSVHDGALSESEEELDSTGDA